MSINLALFIFHSLIVAIVFKMIISVVVGVRKRIDFLNILLTTIITYLPLITILLFTAFSSTDFIIYIGMIIFLEVVVTAFEGAIYTKFLYFDKINPFALAIILNLITCLISETYFRMFSSGYVKYF